MKHENMMAFLKCRILNREYSDNFRLAAALIIKKKTYIGFNKNKTHPLMLRFQKHPESIDLHAEIDVIREALKVTDVADFNSSILYIARLKYSDPSKRENIWGLARPCKGCMMAIEAFNIKKVIYSLDGEKLQYEELQRERR